MSEEEAVIFPDYKGVTIPFNIAPLNFMSGDEELLRIKGKEGIVRIPLRKWQEVLGKMKGQEMQVSVSIWSDDLPDGKTYAPFSIYVAHEKADPCSCSGRQHISSESLSGRTLSSLHMVCIWNIPRMA